MRAPLFVHLLFGASVFLLAKGASADPTVSELAHARQVFEKGRADELAAQYVRGLAKFEEVEKIKSASSVVFHIAFCKEKLGRLLEAADDYDRAEEMAKAEGKVEVLRQIKARSGPLGERLPKLTVTVTVPGTSGAASVTVLLDERPLPQKDWGIEKRISAGTHKIEATSPNLSPFRATVETSERNPQEVKVVFPTPTPVIVTAPTASNVSPVSPPAKPAVVTPPPQAAQATQATQGAPSEVTPPPDRGPKKHANYTATVLASAFTVAFAGAGVASFFVAGAKQDRMLANCPTASTSDCNDLKSPVRTWDTLSLVGFGAAGVSLVTAVVLFSTAKPSSTTASFWEPRGRLRLQPVVAFGGFGGAGASHEFGLRGVLP